MKHVTILVVEDEEIVSMDIMSSLENMHYYPCCAVRTSDTAVAKAREFVPDVVLMDIGIPGSMDGLDAARVIWDELNIPVIFVTSHTDDAVIEKAKLVSPYGYVVKPFTDGGLKVAIEIALSRKAAETQEKRGKEQEDIQVILDGGAKKQDEYNREYTSLPDVRTLFIRDFFDDIVLLLYTDPEVKEQIFTLFMEKNLKTQGNLLFAHSLSKAHRNFLPEIQLGKMRVCRIKKGEISPLMNIFSDNGETSDLSYGIPLRFIVDFSERFEECDILSAVDLILAIRKKGVQVCGIIAIAIGTNDAGLIKKLSLRVPNVIVTTGRGTVISCPDHSLPLESLTFLPQEALDEIVKKVLEPVVLSLLEKPISGHDILQEIQGRYNLSIPKARVYMQLYDLQKNGYLSVSTVGKSKVYSPTETGKKHIRQKLDEFRSVFHHILAEMADLDGSPGFPKRKE
jgi:two-component system, response regulator PdtaR